MDLRLSVPLLSPFTRYSEWKLKMISSLKRQSIYEVSIRHGKESYEDENDYLNDGDRAFGTIFLVFSPSLCYLIDSAEYPKDLWIELDRIFGKNNEDHSSNLESTPNTTRFLSSKVSASIRSNKVIQDVEEGMNSS